MLNEPTIDKLRALKLGAMAATWEAHRADTTIGALTFDERFALLVDAEVVHRENARLTRALREAKLKFPNACIEDLEYGGKRALDRAVVRQLASCDWVRGNRAIVVTGFTGTGKTYVACALAQQACRMGFRALYKRTSRLYDELVLARADGTYARLLDRLAKIDVLVLDDWGLTTISQASRQDLLEVIDDRTSQRSTIIASQLPTSRWHDYIGDPTVADAICDRLLHTAHRLELAGPSRRKTKTEEKKSE
jgi:DNA replication protein DnaC